MGGCVVVMMNDVKVFSQNYIKGVMKECRKEKKNKKNKQINK